MRLIGKSLFVVGVLIIGVTLLNFGPQTEDIAGPRSIIHDSRFVEVMNNLSRLIPGDAVIVVSTNAPFVAYFTGHIVRVPFGANSNDTLINFMQERGYIFLVVFEGRSDVPALSMLFSTKGLKTLEPAFVQLAVYRTDFSIIHVYQMK